MDNMYISNTPPFQRAIMFNDTSVIRVFSPTYDTGSTQCGSNYTKDNVIIELGYTDVIIPKDCVVYTSQLKLIPADLAADDTEIELASPCFVTQFVSVL
jgi:hypothetical protein